MSDRTCLEHDELKHINTEGYPYCVTCRRIELAIATLRAENERLKAENLCWQDCHTVLKMDYASADFDRARLREALEFLLANVDASHPPLSTALGKARAALASTTPKESDNG